MPHKLYIASVWLHVLAATVWIGGMAALGLLLVPLLRSDRFEDVATPMLHESALRFRWIGWGALLVMVVTGLVMIEYRNLPWTSWAFWNSTWGITLAWKLGLVALVLAVSTVHDFYLGPRAIALMEERPEAEVTERMRWWSSWLGRLTLLLSLVILWLAVLLPRGGL